MPKAKKEKKKPKGGPSRDRYIDRARAESELFGAMLKIPRQKGAKEITGDQGLMPAKAAQERLKARDVVVRETRQTEASRVEAMIWGRFVSAIGSAVESGNRSCVVALSDHPTHNVRDTVSSHVRKRLKKLGYECHNYGTSLEVYW